MSVHSMTSPRHSMDIAVRNAGAMLCRVTPLVRSWGQARAVSDVARRWWYRHPLRRHLGQARIDVSCGSKAVPPKSALDQKQTLHICCRVKRRCETERGAQATKHSTSGRSMKGRLGKNPVNQTASVSACFRSCARWRRISSWCLGCQSMCGQ